MSKKTQKKKAVKQQEVKETVVEEKSKFEKIVSYIIYAVGAALIILVIALSINCHGDAGRLAKKYKSLTNENVYELVKFDELQEMISNGEKFDLLLINTKFDEANYFIYCTDLVAKNNNIETVYVFDTYKLKDEETKFFKDIKYNILKAPHIVSYDVTIEDYSVPVDCTVFYDVEEYDNNVYYLIENYFEKMYSEVEEENYN